MKLILLRHGQTPSNVAGLLDTAPPGTGLTRQGEQQAAAIVNALGDEPIEAVFASSQLRAQRTAAPLAQARHLDVRVHAGLREIFAGDLEMSGDADAIHRYIGTLIAWFEGDLARRIPGGPDGTEVLARFDEAIASVEEVVGPSGAAVAVSHGAAIRVWAGMRSGEFGYGQQHLPNTGAVVLNGSLLSGWTVSDWGDHPVGAAHIPQVK